MPQHLPPPLDPDEPSEPAGTTTPAGLDDNSEDEPGGRTIRVRLDPTLHDSPLRRALAAAGLRAPFGINRTRRRGNQRGNQEK